MKTTALAALVSILAIAPAYAFTTESIPTNTHGAALADPDANFDDLADSTPQQGQNQTMQFGGGTIELGSGSQQSPGAQTGSQLFGNGNAPQGWYK